MSNTKIPLDRVLTTEDRDREVLVTKDSSVLQELQNLPVLYLEVAWNLSSELIAKFSTLARSLFTPGILLDIRVVKDLLGGARVSYKGAYYDGSINKLLESKRPEISEIVWKNLKTT